MEETFRLDASEIIREEQEELGEGEDEEKQTAAKDKADSGNEGDRDKDSSPSQSNGNTQAKVAKRKDRLIINVGGVYHETYRSTLKNIPESRLSWLTDASAGSVDYDEDTGEYFFDRHPGVFANILNYYRTGKLHCPLDVCGPLFEEELGYWGIDDQQVESCCWLTYRQHRDAQETLAAFEGVEFDNDFEDEPDLEQYGFTMTAEAEPTRSCYEKYQPRIWTLMEEPYSSILAKVIAYITLTLIVVSVVLFCLETITFFENADLDTPRKRALFIVEGICVGWFTLEFVVRYVFCPNKLQFFKKMMNWFDFLAIVPFYIDLIFGQEGDKIEILMVIRLTRIFRIFKLSRHSTGLQILGHTLRASIRELLLLISFLLIGVVLFASLIYYCEKNVNDTKFTDIPNSFWWAVVTMTTVGYGDMAPTTSWGKFIGSICAVCGVLTIALPVPVIVNNFSLYYAHAQARLKLPKKRRRILVGAHNALKVPAMVENGMSGDSNDSTDSGCTVRNGRKCSLLVTDETSENRPRRPARRDSHLFNNQTTTCNGDGARQTYAMQKRRSMRPTVPTLPEVE